MYFEIFSLKSLSILNAEVTPFDFYYFLFSVHLTIINISLKMLYFLYLVKHIIIKRMLSNVKKNSKQQTVGSKGVERI